MTRAGCPLPGVELVPLVPRTVAMRCVLNVSLSWDVSDRPCPEVDTVRETPESVSEALKVFDPHTG